MILKIFNNIIIYIIYTNLHHHQQNHLHLFETLKTNISILVYNSKYITGT